MKREEYDYTHPPALLPRYERAAVQYDRACIAMGEEQKQDTRPACISMAAALVLYWERRMRRA